MGSNKTILNLNLNQSKTWLPYSSQPLDLWFEAIRIWTQSSNNRWIQVLHNEKQLFATTRNANNIARMTVVVLKNLKFQHHHRSACQWGWRRMGKQLRTFGQPCMILMLFSLTSPPQHRGHCSLDWAPCHQGLCMTSRLHNQYLAKFRLKPCFR